MKMLSLGIAAAFTGCSGLKTPEYTSTSEYRGLQPLKVGRGHAEDAIVYKAPSQSGPFNLRSPVRVFKMNRGFFQHKRRRDHKGLDLGGRRGDDIYAAHPGLVVYAGRKFSGYGKMVLIEYNNTWATLYAHLNKYNVKAGDVVAAGQQIGEMGATGRATGVHLHFELIKNKQPIDPLPYIQLDRFLSSE